MDELVAKAAEELQADVDEIAERCDGDSLEKEVDRALHLASGEIIAPLHDDGINLPYMLRRGHLTSRPAQRAASPEPPPNADVRGSDEAEVFVPDAEIEKEMIEVPSDGAAEFVFLAGKTHVNAWEYLGDEWSSDIVRMIFIYG